MLEEAQECKFYQAKMTNVAWGGGREEERISTHGRDATTCIKMYLYVYI